MSNHNMLISSHKTLKININLWSVIAKGRKINDLKIFTNNKKKYHIVYHLDSKYY